MNGTNILVPCKPWIYWQTLGFFRQLEVCLYKIIGPEVFWFFFSCLEWRAHFVFFPCHPIYMSRKCITLKSLFKLKIAYVWGGLAKRNEYLLSIERIINNFIDVKHFGKEISKPSLSLLFGPFGLSIWGKRMTTFKLTLALATLLKEQLCFNISSWQGSK